MAKKKKRKDEKEKKFKYHRELNGLLLILIAIIGLGGYGIIGNLINNFAIFLVGTYCKPLLALILILGIYVTIKREWPTFFNSKLVGLYLFFLGILVLAHIDYVLLNDIKVVNIFKETINDFMAATKSPSLIQGGGIIGATFSTLFVKMFAIEGTKIVTYALMIFGFVAFTGISLIDSIKWFIHKVKNIASREKNREKIDQAENKFEKDNKVIISSLDELNEIKDEKKEEKPIDQIKPSYNSGYQLPPLSLLSLPKKGNNNYNREAIENTSKILEKTFEDFGLSGKVVNVRIGPAVTQYEMELKAGTKVNKVVGIYKELTLALAATKDVRIQAPIPGKNTIGIEIPNAETAPVLLREILENIPSSRTNSKLIVALGKDIMGRPMFAEVDKMPHLLVAGATGSGKSICINSMIVSLLTRVRPEEVKLLLIDPKKVELSVFEGIPHLIAPVVTDPKKASLALRKVVTEMEQRYILFNKSKTKNIAGYNVYVENQNKTLPETEKLSKLPYIVVIIDELSDLMLVAAKEVEDSILRIAQMARAAGIHLIVATQRPSTDVITGLIKANIPSKIAFTVSNGVDSRTILDMMGAEKLLGKGDMLFKPMDENTPIRIQGAFVSEQEVKSVVDFVSRQQDAEYDTRLIELNEEDSKTHNTQDEEYEEPLYDEIVEFVIKEQKASASLLQRRFRLGYNRAARIIDLLEERGIIGPQNGSKPREVLVKLEESE